MTDAPWAPPPGAHALRATPFGLAAAQNAAAKGARGPRDRADLRVISCHLGGSSSVTGILNGVAIGNSLGMSPQSGVPQNNRVGDLDSAALPYAMHALHLSLDEAVRQLAQESGLKGLSGLSNDVRDLERAAAGGHACAARALDVFATGVRHWIGVYFLELNGADALVFTGGIGQHSARMRERICANLDQLGIVLDEAANAPVHTQERRISADRSRVHVWMIPTNEELVVAREARRLLVAAQSTTAGAETPHDEATHDVSRLQPLTQD